MATGSLAQGLEILTAETDVYQTPQQLNRVKLTKAQFVNTGGAAITFSAWITPADATSTSNALKVIDSKQIGNNETYVAIELIGEYINTGGKLIVQSDNLGLSAWVNGNTFKTEV